MLRTRRSPPAPGNGAGLGLPAETLQALVVAALSVMSTRRTLPESPYLAAAAGRKPQRVPVWFMRQAGRSLPEYRALRAQHTMMAACFDAELIAEITLQPVRRHGVDAAILFSDIVVPLRGAGVDLDIVADVGPVIATPMRTGADIETLKPLDPQRVQPVSDAVARLVGALGDVPLIGFAGAPFTLASYLVEGGPSRHHARTKAMMLAEPACWHALMEKLTDLTVDFLRVQLDAGVDAIQVFDSWAGALSLADYRRYVLPHSERVFATLAAHDVPMTHFGVGTAELLGAMSAALKAGEKPARAAVVGVDWRTSLIDAAARVETGTALQGNLDPAVLLAGWPVVERAARAVVDDGRRAVDAGASGHVFNLGHGVLPETDPGVLTELVSMVHTL
jgi:uroporphyrinogen decarboxylase